MKAYRVRTEGRISPFSDPARDLFIGVRTLADWQAAAVKGAGLELVDVDAVEAATDRPCLLFFDDVYFTEMALRQFLADTLTDREDRQIAMADSPILSAVEPLQGARSLKEGGAAFELFRLVDRAPTSREALIEKARPSVLKQRGAEIELRLPPVVGGKERETNRRIAAPLTARIVAHVRHWLHLLRLSQLSIGVEIVERLRKKPRLMLRLRMMKGKDPWALARKINFVHETARVHPTADLECAVIGPGAVVNAHAHVHRSVLGENVEVGDHAAVVGCTFAADVQVLRASYFALCASMPGGTLANYKAQLSLFGREVFLTSSALLIDAKLEGEAEVLGPDGAPVSVGTPFLGSCLGHRVTLGANVALLPGREVPNGQTVVGPPSGFVRTVPNYPEGSLLVVRDGRLEPM